MITSLPAFFDMYYTDPKDGKLTSDGYMYNDQMFQTLNTHVTLTNSIATSVIDKQNVKVTGINPPSYTTLQITGLQPSVPVGTIWYNSTLKKLQFKSDAGLIETITST